MACEPIIGSGVVVGGNFTPTGKLVYNKKILSGKIQKIDAGIRHKHRRSTVWPQHRAALVSAWGGSRPNSLDYNARGIQRNALGSPYIIYYTYIYPKLRVWST